MKGIKKILLMIVVTLMILTCSFVINTKTANAASNIAGGECGDNLEWWLTTEGVLTIQGTGNMDHWTIWGGGSYPGWDNYRADIKQVVIKKGVTNVGDMAFENCTNLVKVTLPSTITVIEDEAFRRCTNLKTINIPNKVTSINSYAFSECSSLKKITLPSSLKTIGMCAFEYSGLTSIVIPPTLTSTNGYAFCECDSLQTATIGVGTGSFELQYEDFYGCDNLKTVKIGNAVKSIGRLTFMGCKNLSNLTIGDKVEVIYGRAFSGCTSLKEVFIPHSVKRLDRESWGYGPFADCTSLEKVVIGKGMESITPKAFYNCPAIKKVYFCGDAPTFEGTETFAGATLTAYYPKNNNTWRPSNMTNHGGYVDWQPWKVPVSYYRVTMSSVTNKSNGILVKWKKLPNAKGYYVYRKVADGAWTKCATVTGASYTDKKATVNGRKYQYKVVAYDNNTKSKDSYVKTTYRVKRTTPSKVSSTAKGKLTVKWSKNSAASGYQIRYSKKSGFGTFNTVTLKKAARTKTISGLTKGNYYYVKMRAFKTVNGNKYYSDWSTVKKVKVKK